MDKDDLRIVFMGTPDFAVGSLQALVENGYNIVGVVTMPDKPSGRGHKIQYSAVKKYALDHDLPILQPEKLKDEDFLRDLRAWNADLQIVVAFRMLPEVVWNMPQLGTFNLHASLLPQYRGAAPINWAIINGENQTGVTTFFLTHEIDTGKIIKQKKIEITTSDDAGTVHDKLMQAGAQMVCETVDLIIDNKVEAIDQSQFVADESTLKAAPKIFKDGICHIDWTQDVEDIHNVVRGLSPYPVAWTTLITDDEEQLVKIFASGIVGANGEVNGKIITDNKSYLHVVCGDGNCLSITELQPAGKKRMIIKEFFNGYKLAPNTYFK